jgi:hypothetical protein
VHRLARHLVGRDNHSFGLMAVTWFSRDAMCTDRAGHLRLWIQKVDVAHLIRQYKAHSVFFLLGSLGTKALL